MSSGGGGTEKHDLEQAVYDTLRYFAIYSKPLTDVQIWRSLIVDKAGKGTRWHGHQVPALRDIEEVLAGEYLSRLIWRQWGYYGLKSELRSESSIPFSPLGEKERMRGESRKVGLIANPHPSPLPERERGHTPNSGRERGHTPDSERRRGHTSSSGREREYRQEYTRAYLRKHAIAQLKWRLLKQIVRRLTWIPFVRMLGGSGSLALFTARKSSDLDLLVIVKEGRIWTARLLLLSVTHLMRRRRKYWDRTAPNKVCLNHYITDRSLTMKPEIRNVYTAVLWHHVVPFYGLGTFKKWVGLNDAWIKRWLMFPEAGYAPARLRVRISLGQRRFRKWIENFLEELPGDWLEKWAEKVQRKFIVKHTMPGRLGRVVVSNEELAFHPDSKVPVILNQYYEEEGQISLL